MKNVKIVKIVIVTMLVCLAIQILEVKAMMIFNSTGIEKITSESLKVTESGTYYIWLWGRGGTSVTIKIDEAELKNKNFGSGNIFSWGKVGQLELSAEKAYEFKMASTQKDDVAWFVLTSDENFNPQRIHELMSIYPERPSPLPDLRYREMRHTYSSFPFPEYDSLEDWKDRKNDIRRKILVSAGLWPMPEPCPLNVKVVETLDRDGYTVEKMYMETWPGYYFPCSLYRPKDKSGSLPGIINPHGHWAEGRMAEAVQKRCANFALQGYIALSYNMVGYIDNNQLDHRFRSDELYLWSVSVGGLQLWNSIRALDFITSLPEVDNSRIACTGCSGGGSQTFLVTAVDDRIKVTAPVCMVSSHFQGGCICENAPSLRLDTYNVEIAATAAPIPQILVGATGDWTDLTPEVEYPEVLSIYKMMGIGNKLTYYYQDAGHNYNQNSREAVYKWFGKWLLNENDESKFREVETPFETIETLRTFDKKHKRPDSAPDQNSLLKSITSHFKNTLDAIWPRGIESLKEYREIMLPALGDVLNVKVPDTVNAKLMPNRGSAHVKRENFMAARYILTRPGEKDQVPAIVYKPRSNSKTANLIVYPQGKAGLVDMNSGKPSVMVESLIEKGQTVVGIDTFLTGDHHSPLKDTVREKYCTYFSTFNVEDEALRIQDIVTAAIYLQGKYDSVNIIGLDEAGLWCFMARAFLDNIDNTVVDVMEFDTNAESAWVEKLNIPGILRVGGFDTAVACIVPDKIFIHNTGSGFDTERMIKLYGISGVDDKLNIRKIKVADSEILAILSE
ncbi:hypothetical protein GF312_04405 [Candidatus Poribacteria bacterium]|nr:hypothetical protein [Candidatus Poribacteria bacterium]